VRKELFPGLFGLLDLRRWKFEWRYRRGKTPWDTNASPPEVKDFIAVTPPGRALDLGCGTGTHAIALARHGWQVTGVDFAPWAIRRARQKASDAGVTIRFFTADVTELGILSGGYDYALDIGCLFGLKDSQQTRYAAQLARLMAPGGRFMLFAWLPGRRKGKTSGITPEAVARLLGAAFHRDRLVIDQQRKRPAAWYWYRRR
jgi:ubiquinone/menaquinone biosynthesis C-methylase UbiE